jgi:hypothetical protein
VQKVHAGPLHPARSRIIFKYFSLANDFPARQLDDC